MDSDCVRSNRKMRCLWAGRCGNISPLTPSPGNNNQLSWMEDTPRIWYTVPKLHSKVRAVSWVVLPHTPNPVRFSVWVKPTTVSLSAYAQQRHGFSFKDEEMQTDEFVSVLEKPIWPFRTQNTWTWGESSPGHGEDSLNPDTPISFLFFILLTGRSV